jgi:hypothetical protein
MYSKLPYSLVYYHGLDHVWSKINELKKPKELGIVACHPLQEAKIRRIAI